MFSRIKLRQFKCFENLTLPLAPLTFLSGTNSSGKSSVLQALAMLHQTVSEYEWSSRLILNAGSVQMGTVADIVDKLSGRTEFELALTDDDHEYHWKFIGDRKDMSMAVKEIRIDDSTFTGVRHFSHLLPADLESVPADFSIRLREMTYLTAERTGPREYYHLEEIQTGMPDMDRSIQTEGLAKFAKTTVGPHGENCISFIYMGGEEKINADLSLPGFPPTRQRQVEAWMREFFPGFEMEITSVKLANAVTLGLRCSRTTDYLRPSHVGFGLTQVLPIVVAVLFAEKGDVILIENPEVHLHPMGQSKMGAFLAKVVSTGIQIILETHSDHVLNGIRRAVHSGHLSPEQAAIHFFGSREGEHPQVISPQIDKTGDLDVWPKNFFDQQEQDLNFLLGWGG